MNPIRSREDLFRIYLHDYLRKRGLHHTAEIFQREAQVSRQPPAEFDIIPHGFLHDWWVLFYDTYNTNSRQPMPGSSSIEAQNVGSIWDGTPQIFRERYSLQFLGGFPSNNVLSSCHFSSDGKTVASGGLEKKVFLCYMDTCDCVTTLDAHSDPISDVRFQPDSTIFATSSSDKTVKIWDSTKPGIMLFNILGHNGLVRSLDFHPIEKEVLCSSDSFDVIELWNISQCVKIKNFMAGGQVVRFQPCIGRFLAVANGNLITILDIQSWRIQNRLQGHLSEVRSLCWDTTGLAIASVSEDCARVWSIAVCGYCIHELKSNGKKFQSITFHPRYHNVLVIGAFQCLYLWIPEREQVYTVPAHNGSITGLAASTQNEFIASASSDYMVKIWK